MQSGLLQKKREGARLCIGLLLQLREKVFWSPAVHGDFPKCRRKHAATVGYPLLRAGILIAKFSAKVPETPVASIGLRDAWLQSIPALLRESIQPTTRVVGTSPLESLCPKVAGSWICPCCMEKMGCSEEEVEEMKCKVHRMQLAAQRTPRVDASMVEEVHALVNVDEKRRRGASAAQLHPQDTLE